MKRWIVAASVVAVAVPAWLFLISPFTLAVLENVVPDVAELRLPPGTTIVATEKQCGSGGCWLEVDLRPADGTSEAELLAALGIDHDRETCELGGAPMFWTTCRGRSDASAHRDRVVAYFGYKRTP